MSSIALAETLVSRKVTEINETEQRLLNLFEIAGYETEPLNNVPHLKVYSHTGYYPIFFIWDTKKNSIICANCIDDLTGSLLKDIYLAHNPTPRSILLDLLSLRNPVRAHYERLALSRRCCANKYTLEETIDYFRLIDHESQ